jgi:serine/threonine protein kinase
MGEGIVAASASVSQAGSLPNASTLPPPQARKVPSDFADLIEEGEASSQNQPRSRYEIADADMLTVRATLASHGYQLRNHLGSGGFASIFEVRHIGYEQEFAAKIMNASQGGCTLAEVTNLLPLLHPNIIKIYDTFQDDQFFYLIMEYCPGGTLKDRVLRSGPLRYPQFRRIAEQLLNAVNYCHSMRVAHCDIKPQNVFFDAYDRPKLADFGLSRSFDSELSYGGSIPFMAPEIVTKARMYDPIKSDIWSLGVTFFFCATGDLPWRSSTMSGMLHEIEIGEWSRPSGFDNRILSLLVRMLRPPPECRPTLPRLLQCLAACPALPPVSPNESTILPRASRTHSSPTKSPVRWVDVRRTVGRPKRVIGISLLLPQLEQRLPQPEFSAWEGSSDPKLTV